MKNNFFLSIVVKLFPWKWPLLGAFLVITMFMVYGSVKHFNMDASLDSWLEDGNSTKVALEEYRAQFGSDDGVYIVYAPKDGDIFSETSLDTLAKLHEELEERKLIHPHTAGDIDSQSSAHDALTRIQRLTSLYNVRFQIADGDTLISDKLLESDFPESEADRNYRKAIATSQSNLRLAFYSDDFRYGGIEIKTNFGLVPEINEDIIVKDGLDQSVLLEDEFDADISLSVTEDTEIAEVKYKDVQMMEYLEFMTSLKEVTEKPEYQHFEFYYSGNAPTIEFAVQVLQQTNFLVLILILLVFILLLTLFRSFSAVVWPLIVIVASVFWVVGSASWSGVTLSSMVTLTFMLVITVGIADCVHVLSSYILHRRRNMSHLESMKSAYKSTSYAIFLTTITTMIGMGVLYFSNIPQISVFGITSALGVAMAFLLTIFILPVFLQIWHPNSTKYLENETHNEGLEFNRKSMLDRILISCLQLVRKTPKTIFTVYIVALLIFSFGISQIEVNSNFAEMTKEGSELRITNDIIDNNMMGGQNLEIMLDLKQPEALKTPSVLQAINDLQRHMEEKYSDYVIKTLSLSDLVKQTNKIMHGGSATYETIPQDSLKTAQLIYLFDNANPVDRSRFVSDDYSKSHISVFLRNAGSREYSKVFSSMRNDIDIAFSGIEASYPGTEINVTGSLVLMMELTEHISWSQIKSFVMTMAVITLLLIVLLGSIQAGFISLIPNLLPAICAFGLMGLLGIPLDNDTLIIAPLIIGIAVDDTIHFMTHYKRVWYETGDVEKALDSTMHEVGQAVTFTTIILVAGFSILAFSDHLGFAKVGVFGSLAIFIALLSDLLLLPAIIKLIKPQLGRDRYLQQQRANYELVAVTK